MRPNGEAAPEIPGTAETNINRHLTCPARSVAIMPNVLRTCSSPRYCDDPDIPKAVQPTTLHHCSGFLPSHVIGLHGSKITNGMTVGAKMFWHCCANICSGKVKSSGRFATHLRIATILVQLCPGRLRPAAKPARKTSSDASGKVNFASWAQVRNSRIWQVELCAARGQRPTVLAPTIQTRWATTWGRHIVDEVMQSRPKLAPNRSGVRNIGYVSRGATCQGMVLGK